MDDKWYKTNFNGTHWEAWGTHPDGGWVATYNGDNATEQDAIDDLFYELREQALDQAMEGY